MPPVKTPLYTDPYLVASVDAAFSVLAHIAREPDQSLQEIAGRCQLSVSQTNRLLHTLRMHGYILKTPLKRYRLGYSALNLGHHANHQFPLIEYAAADLDQVWRETQESVHLVQRSGLEVIILDLRESLQNVRVVSEIGKRGPLHLGGSGKVYLAYDDPKLLEQMLALNASAPDTSGHSTLVREIRQIREQGYYVARGDFEAEAFSIAAPILGTQHRIVGSLAISGPLARLTPEHEGKLIASCLAAVSRIGQQIQGKL
ncbi:IclR family transcriptional regulator (plasmid) [Deinococcus psychrotolerans]|uniref:IclR family transcriptional regulator n=1 Tax=Deinococcus psychrotolerans TaxID=2489213 RepID=A0A3G8YJ67_9DEIO|nr:IclR family transcriptional regulator [Deinococcus psychrotolerans]AZI44955.1 IclR family transcriptional regulator [Deinococcus psychrotolerans]